MPPRGLPRAEQDKHGSYSSTPLTKTQSIVCDYDIYNIGEPDHGLVSKETKQEQLGDFEIGGIIFNKTRLIFFGLILLAVVILV